MSTAERLAEALGKLIDLNRQHACDQYGDANKAESWACVRIAREALAAYRSTPADGGGQGVTPLTPEQRRRLWDNSPEIHGDATSRAGFERIVALVEAVHRIGTPASTAPTVDDVWDRHTLLGPPDDLIKE